MKPKYSQRNTFAIPAGCGAIVLALTSFAVQAAPTNTKTGTNAGASFTTGKNNTADGFSALRFTKTGKANTAVGALALNKNVSGSNNAAFGFQALYKNVAGNLNTALGDGSLMNCTGSQNIGIGQDGGFNLTNGNNNIAIGNDGVVGESNKIRIGTSGVHTDTFLTGVIHGNGSGLTGLSIPASSVTGAISGSQVTNGSINNAKLATGSVTSAKLVPNLILGGTTTGNFSGSLAGNASSATSAGSISTSNIKLSERSSGTFGDAASYAFDGGANGLLLETWVGGSSVDSGGLFLNNSTAALYSPGDGGNILSVFDEDFLGDATPVSAFRVLNSNEGISTPGVVYQGANQKYRSTADEEGLKIVRGGVIGATGAITKGSAYSVVRGGAGVYTITFTTPFASAPSVTGNARNNTNYMLNISAATISSVIIYINNTSNANVDQDFDFIAIGPR